MPSLLVKDKLYEFTRLPSDFPLDKLKNLIRMTRAEVQTSQEKELDLNHLVDLQVFTPKERKLVEKMIVPIATAFTVLKALGERV